MRQMRIWSPCAPCAKVSTPTYFSALTRCHQRLVLDRRLHCRVKRISTMSHWSSGALGVLRLQSSRRCQRPQRPPLCFSAPTVGHCNRRLLLLPPRLRCHCHWRSLPQHPSWLVGLPRPHGQASVPCSRGCDRNCRILRVLNAQIVGCLKTLEFLGLALPRGCRLRSSASSRPSSPPGTPCQRPRWRPP